MTESKLITLLKKLSPEEFKRLEKFASSPYLASGREFTPLYTALKKFYPDFDDRKLTKEFIFKKIYPDEKYAEKSSDNKVNILFTGFYKLCLDFLIYDEFNADHNRKNYYLLNQLRVKNLDKEFEQVNSASLHGNDFFKGSITDFINKSLLYAELKNFLLKKDDYKKMFEASFKMREYSLMTALVNCLKHDSEKTVMKAYKAEVRENLMDGLLENLNIEKFLESAKRTNNEFYIYLLVNYYIYKLEKNRSELKYFYELKDLLHEHHDKFGAMEKFSLWINMETYCNSMQIETGNQLYSREVFEIYKDMLEFKIYKASPIDDFNIVMYRNILRTAARLKEFEWLNNFIQQYSGELNSRHKEDMKNYSLALVSFGNGKFEDALKYIMAVQFELFLYKIDVKILMLKIYFELNYFEQTLSGIDTTLHYLKSTNDLSDPHKEIVRQFVRYLKELVKIVSNPESNKDELGFLRKKILEEKAVNSREWFFEKIDGKQF